MADRGRTRVERWREARSHHQADGRLRQATLRVLLSTRPALCLFRDPGEGWPRGVLSPSGVQLDQTLAVDARSRRRQRDAMARGFHRSRARPGRAAPRRPLPTGEVSVGAAEFNLIPLNFIPHTPTI